jgi:hypothetical protein
VSHQIVVTILDEEREMGGGYDRRATLANATLDVSAQAAWNIYLSAILEATAPTMEIRTEIRA